MRNASFITKVLVAFSGLVLLVFTLKAQSAFDTTGFTSTKTGLLYKIARKGQGNLVQNGDRVWVHYIGKLQNDSIFSSTQETGPLDIFVGQGNLIKAWEEALLMMQKGSAIVLLVPPHLGYGEEGSSTVPPNSWTKYEIMLLQIDRQEQIKPYDADGKEWKVLAKEVKIMEIEAGTGETPKNDYLVYLHYTGFLPDSTIFSTSRTKERSLKLRIGNPNMMGGWSIALPNVQKGGKYKLFFPYQQAYGRRGLKNTVPGKTNVIMDVEVLEVKAPPVITPWISTGDTISTLSGLSYVVIDPGHGELIKDNDMVMVHYSGFLANGTIFDSSVKFDEPLKVPVGAQTVIDGWEEGLKLMRPGAKFKLFIPFHLAYGEQGSQPEIPPYADLIFDMEIISVNQ